LIGPIATYSIALFVRHDNSSDISLESLHGQVLGAERGSITEQWLIDHHIKFEPSTHDINCLKMVVANRVSACALGTLSGIYVAALYDMFGQLRVVETNKSADLYIALSKNLDESVIESLKVGYKKLKSTNYFQIQQQEYEKRFNLFLESMT